MPVQADFLELLDNDSDEEDTDFKISSDDDSYISLKSSESINVIPPTPDRQNWTKIVLFKRRSIKEENFNERERIEEKDKEESKEDEDESSDNKDKDEGEDEDEDTGEE